VRDDWQNKGIGTELLRYLAQVAVRNGIRGFTAEVLRANRAMQRVFHKVDYQVTSQPQDDVYSFVIEFG
jgi:GNAT superfamily N-acetyltransferase